MFRTSAAWKAEHPGAAAGILAMRNVRTPAEPTELDHRLAQCEAELRARFGAADRATLRGLPVLRAYAAYFGRYRKTYHVQLQLESVVWKGRSIPRRPALVATMVMAELKHLLLTAGHDFDAVRLPITVDVATGRERYVLLRGEEEELKPGDMMMVDGDGIISSVLYGPDRRTRLTETTAHVLFAVYAPPGIAEAALIRHLQELRDTILVWAPGAEVATLETRQAG